MKINFLRTTVLILILGQFTYAFGQDVVFRASAPGAVRVGEPFRIIYSVNTEGSNFIMPQLPDFDILSGPSVSSSSNISIINGNMTRTQEFTYGYIVRAQKEGKYTIGPASINVKKDTYESNALNIEVVAGAQQVPQGGGAPAQGNSNSVTASSQNIDASDDIFVRVLVDKTQVYIGEPVVATLKIFTKSNLSGLENLQPPKYSGFYKQDIEVPQLRNLNQETVNGEIYGTGIFQKVLLFPQKTGELVIDPFTIDAQLQQRVRRNSNSFFDDFFGGYQTISKSLESKPIRIKVLPLPTPQPADYNGAVGQFKIQASIDKTEAVTNDPITLKVNITGNGNIRLIDKIKVDLPQSLETYEPKINNNIQNTASGASGTKTFEYLMIPRHAGKFRIAPITFTYFDLAAKSYKTLTTSDFNINIEKGEDYNPGNIVSGLSKEDIKFIGSDIRYIKTGNPQLRLTGNNYLRQKSFMLGYIIASLIFGMSVFFLRKKIKQNSNLALVKNRRATKMAQKRLSVAASWMKKGSQDLYYQELAKALWGYLADKMNIPLSQLSKDKIIAQFELKNTPQNMVEQYLKLIDTCEYARYAPVDNTITLENHHEEAVKCISNIDNYL